MRVDKEVRLVWTGVGLAFAGVTADGLQVMIDGDSIVAPAPMEMLLLAVTGCMAIDIRDILKKSRVPLKGLDIVAQGERAGGPPRRYTAIRFVVTVGGVPATARARVERAIALSRDKYCSVLFSMRRDLPVEFVLKGV